MLIIMLPRNYDEEIQRLKKCVAGDFYTEYLGSLKSFLGIEVARSR